MSYYCICEPRGANNVGYIPCPDSDKCSMCGKINPDYAPVKITLNRGELSAILNALDELCLDYGDLLDNGSINADEREYLQAKLDKLRTAEQKISRQFS